MAGADALGLVFYEPSPRYVSIQAAQVICSQLPAFVSVVALCVDKPAEDVKALVQQLPIDVLQFHGSETPDYCEQFSTPWLKAIRVATDSDVGGEIERFSSARGILLDTYRKGVPGGTGERFDWELIPEAHRAQIILAGGLTAGNVARAIETVGPYAVDVSGGVESSPGVKDPKKIRAFMQQVNAARSD